MTDWGPKTIYMMGEEALVLDDIIGQEPAKDKAQQFINLLCNKQIFKLYGLEIPHILMHGPVGTGKTMLAKAIAFETINQSENICFFSMNLQDIGTAYVNETANNFTKIMDYCYSLLNSETPAFEYIVMFIDEFDSVGMERGSSRTTSESDKLVNAINSYMDGDRKIDNLSFIAATNYYDLLDVSQKSRYGLHIKFSNFINKQEIADLFKSNIEIVERNKDKTIKFSIFKNIDHLCLAESLDIETINGRMVKDIISLALQYRINQIIDTKTKEALIVNIHVTMDDFKHVIKDYVTERKPKNRLGFNELK